jgi:ABC-type multidrug transport system ATPase subunit
MGSRLSVVELSVDSLMHSFGDLKVLAGVFLRCAKGEIVGILGRNGSGKTTILRSIFGTLPAQSIHLSVDGAYTERAYLDGSVAYLAQEPFLPRRSRVSTVVWWFLADPEQRAIVLQDPRVKRFARSRVNHLSAGEKRYLETLMVLRLRAPYLLMDEPFTEVEPLYRESLKHAIRRRAGEGKGFILTDHAYHDIVDVCDRVYVLAQGELYPADAPEDLARYGYTPAPTEGDRTKRAPTEGAPTEGAPTEGDRTEGE